MPASTPGGWPYVLPADHPLEYPAQSLQLANQLQAYQDGKTAALTLQAGWSGTITLRRFGNLVVAELATVAKATAPVANEYIAVLPPGYIGTAYTMIPTWNATAGSGLAWLVAGGGAISTHNPAPAQAFKHFATAVWRTADAMPA